VSVSRKKKNFPIGGARERNSERSRAQPPLGMAGLGVERESVRRSSETRTDNEQKLWFDKKRLSLVA